MPDIFTHDACDGNAAIPLDLNGRAEPPTGAAPIIPDDPTALPVAVAHNHEFVGPMVVTDAIVKADSGVSTLLEVDILVRQTNDPDDQIIITWGHDVSFPLGSQQTFRAPTGTQLSGFSVTLAAGEALNISTQGLA